MKRCIVVSAKMNRTEIRLDFLSLLCHFLPCSTILVISIGRVSREEVTRHSPCSHQDYLSYSKKQFLDPDSLSTSSASSYSASLVSELVGSHLRESELCCVSIIA